MHASNVKVGGGAFGSFGSKYGLGNVGKHEAKAVVQITARLIDTSTAEILAKVSGKGESQRSGTNLLGGGSGGESGGGGAFDMSSSNFANTILGEAVNNAVTEVATKLIAENGRLPTVTVQIDGLVADASGGSIVLNIGSKAGLKAGDQLHIKRTTREIKDPETGKVIRRIEDTVGTVTLTDVDANSAVGTFSGPGTPR